MRRYFIPLLASIAAAALLPSCGERSTPAPPAGTPVFEKLAPPPCYSGDNGTPYTASATVTFYGWPDNSPPGNQIAHPVIHNVASGDGSYCNPTTFATEPTSSENKKIPYGTRIYVPLVQKYFIREDDCTTSGPQGLGCSGLWFDLWIGGDASSNPNTVINCENSLTPSGSVSVVIHPPNNEPVAWTGAIFNDPNLCNKNPNPSPSPSPTHSPSPSPSPSRSPSPTPSPTSTPGGSITANVEWYDYFDNGNSCAIAHPVIHSCAGGSGTWSDPITFATSTSNNSIYPYGSVIYMAALQRYFIREDDCGSGQCTGNTFNIWIGGNSSDNQTDMAACETYLTNTYLSNGQTTIVVNPPSNEPVSPLGQIWNESNGECNGSYNYSKAHLP